MEERIEQLEKEVQDLRKRVYTLENAQRNLTTRPQYNRNMRPRMQQNQAPVRPDSKRRTRISEEKIGIYGLPILATVMIIAGLGVLSYMIWGVVSDTNKAIFILLLSILCASIGIIAGRNESFRVFKNTMVALSMAIIYIDIIAMHWAWKLIPEMVTILFVLFWCASGALLSHFLKDRFYYYVALTGLSVSTLIGQGMIKADASGIPLVLILLLAYTSLNVFYQMKYKERNACFGICATIIFFFLTFSSYNMKSRLPETAINPLYGLLFNYIVYIFAAVLTFADRFVWSEKDEKRNLVSYILISMLVPFGILNIIENTSGVEVGYILLSAILFYCMYKKQNIFICLFSAIYLAITCCWVQLGEIKFLYTVFVILAAYAVYLITSKKYFKYFFYIMSVFGGILSWYIANSVYFPDDDYLGSVLVTSVLAAISLVIAVLQFYQKERWVFSISMSSFVVEFLSAGYILSLVREPVSWAENSFQYKENWQMYAFFIAFAVIVYIAIVILKKTWFHIEATNLDKIHAVITDLCLMIIFTEEQEPILSIALLIQTAFLMYIFDILYNRSNVLDVGYGILATINFSVLYFNSRLSDIAILYSIVLIIIASSCIVLGSIIKRKSFRIYGLVLMLIGVIKMVLIDIHGDNSIIKVLALICGGVLCLAISYAYNLLEKELLNEKEE